MNQHPFNASISAVLGSPIADTAPMSVGFGLNGLSVRLADGRRLAVKARSSAANGPSLEIEGYMLRELRRLSELPVPQVHLAEADLLVMDFIDNDGGTITAETERDAAAQIAALHAVPRQMFGYDRDTRIGPLLQPNPKTGNWVAFFRDHRLRYMARLAHEERRIESPLFGRIERLAERVGDYLTEPAHPSLLHGDLWTGNVLVKGNEIAGYIDPATYFGHPEIELAFTTMFGTFGRAFFDTYEGLLPLEPGFHEVRRDLYNLYPMLVHVRLFGGSYTAGVNRTLKKLGF